MSFSLIPKMLCPALTDLTVERLHRAGVTFLMLDFDNTIVPYTNDVPTPEMEAWLQAMQASDIGLCVVSNSHKTRVVKFCEARGIPCITHSKKPFSKGIFQCRDKFSLDLSHAALVGDQIYTDTLGGNRLGALTCYVETIDRGDFWIGARYHLLERAFIRRAKRRSHDEHTD